ncbi:Rpn family recombination-promoting nuclease/putative transposase [Roseiconus nitratireducens]|uniref:Rpn family recombination-promoting nuclease/putative transposase n=1 Tax=Roseiconus nitratireducens TaxID=2605748 RepID=A0A5M6CUV4_9BACT|nr:Rpn family recombination-promoting nuclease/putative transposase [Roseiconus nitratireducens]KAA5538994.1 Rpn family recombination-promoting nuclease/putative transposase [Roseiconus nitratireducens]
MAIGIDPTVDFAFKRVLGSPEHASLTVNFLNAVLADEHVIRSVEFLNPFLDKDFEEDKLAILDIRARDDRGRWLNVEIQTTLPGKLPERLTYYVASQYVGQMREGQRYGDLCDSIGICVLEGIRFPQVPDIHLDFRFRSRDAGLKLSDSLQIHLLELPKYAAPADNVPITDPVEKWVYFLQSAEHQTREQLVARLGEETFSEAAGVLEMIARTPRERELYEARLKLQRDEQSRLDAALAQGLEKGQYLGRIQLLESLLGQDTSPTDALKARSVDELQALEADLQRRLRERDLG